MAKEIERKYLVLDKKYKLRAIQAIEISQGYLNRDPLRTVRIRLKGDEAYITVKGCNVGCVRDEWEYSIDPSDAKEMLSRVCDGIVISKTRYIIPFNGLIWEVDEFHNSLDGLTVAEVELPNADYYIGELPEFIGREVTGDVRYYNSSLVDGVKPPCV